MFVLCSLGLAHHHSAIDRGVSYTRVDRTAARERSRSWRRCRQSHPSRARIATSTRICTAIVVRYRTMTMIIIKIRQTLLSLDWQNLRRIAIWRHATAADTFAQQTILHLAHFLTTRNFTQLNTERVALSKTNVPPDIAAFEAKRQLSKICIV